MSAQVFMLPLQHEPVLDVLPGGPDWRAGLTAGDRVLMLYPSDTPGGWRLTVERGDSAYSATMIWMTSQLREGAPAALGGLAMLAAYLAHPGSNLFPPGSVQNS